MDSWHLIVGLGNPGAEYAATRHNAGFRVVELLAERWHATWKGEGKLRSRLSRAEFSGRKVLLCEPRTFMNASGEAVAAVMSYHQIAADRMLIILDDADLPLGEIRMRPGGGTGGHHGLESIQEHVAGCDHARLRIGIGRREGQREIAGHVLGRFNSGERETAEKVFRRAAEQAEVWLGEGIDRAMNRFNGVLPDAEQTEGTE